jgi:hypothetical protein
MPDLNMDRVVELLKAKGVDNAYVEQTGGGVATIFAGPTFEEPEYGTRYAACAGPGTYGWQSDTPSMGSTEDFCVGADDYGDGPCKFIHEEPDVPAEQVAAEEYVAQVIYDRVVEYAVDHLVTVLNDVKVTEDVLREQVTELIPMPLDGSDAYFDLCGKVVEAVLERQRNPRAEALEAGTVLGQFEDHEDDCEFATGKSATCTCGER